MNPYCILCYLTYFDVAFIANLVTIFGIVFIALQIYYLKKEREDKSKLNEAELLLRIREMMIEHNEIHVQLRKGIPIQSNLSDEEWAKIESYMGLFEACYIFIEKDLITMGNFKKQFGYRVKNILNDKTIVQKKLIEEKDFWEDFIALTELIKKTN